MMKVRTQSPLTVIVLACLILLLYSNCNQRAEAEDDPAAEEAANEEESTLDRFLAMFDPPEPITVTVSDTAILNRKSTTNQESVTQRYSRIYRLIHRQESAYYQSLVDSSYTDWNELHQLSDDAKYLGEAGDTIVLAKNIKVLGWHPHWMGDAYKYYSFNLLSHVSLFSYSVSTGGETEPFDNPEVVKGWESPNFELIKLAHEQDCKVLITLSNFGTQKNRDFLSNVFRQDRLIEDIFLRLQLLDVDGVDVDFEEIPRNYEKQFTDFIKRLKNKLRTGTKDYELSVVLPKVDQYNIYNIDTLQQYVDIFTLTGYDFTTGDFASGPIAPLYKTGQPRGQKLNIEDVVFSYLEKGLDRKKLLLGLPYYGGKWSTLSGPNVEDSTYFSHFTFSNIRKAYWRAGTPEYDLNSWAAVYRQQTPLKEAGKFTHLEEVLWFDDSLTLSVKYDWVLEQGLGGVGIWALGYDQPYTELWGLIDHKFAPVNDTLVYYQPAQSALSLPYVILRYRDMIALSGLFVFVFLAVGFIWALFDPKVRQVFFEQKTLRTLYIVAAFAIVTAAFAVFLVINPGLIGQLGLAPVLLFALTLGLVLGAFLVRYINRKFSVARSKIP